MKKYAAIILGVLFVLSFAASAFAVHSEIPAETQAVVAKGSTQVTIGGELRTRGWYENDINGSAQPVDEGSSAWYDQRVRLTVDAQISPNVQGFIMLESNIDDKDIYNWGNFNKKPAGLTLREAWILYKGSGLFGFPAGLKIGHMPLALGEKQFFDHTKFGDDAIVFFMDPTKELHVGLLAIKFDEGNIRVQTDDLDGYVGLLTYKLDDKNTLGLNYTYLNKSAADFDHQNLELHANGNISGIGYKFSGDIQFGGESEDVDFGGWAVMAGLSYKMDALTLRGSFGYGSGDDDATDGDQDAFKTYLGADQHYALVYDYQVVTASGKRFTGLENTMYFNLGVDYQASKDVKLSLDGLYLQANETSNHVDDNLGWEIDANVAYNIAKNLTYGFSIGYFDAGDFYDDMYGDAKGATVVRHTLTLNF